jgi:hypothetical protein
MELRAKFYVATSCAVASTALFLVTLVWPAWIELVFRIDPDRGSGALEKAVVIAAAALALVFALLMHIEWRRLRQAAQGGGHG